MCFIKRLAAILLLCVWASASLAHTDGVTQARLTIEKAQRFRLEVLNFDVLSYIKPELQNAGFSSTALQKLSDDQLGSILSSAQSRFSSELIFVDQSGEPLAYDLQFVSLQGLKHQLQIKPTVHEESGYIIKATGQLQEDQQEIYMEFPAALNQVALKTVTISNVHVAPGERSSNLLSAAADSESWLSIVTRYVELGYVHILPKGLDHILFVLGLFFLSCKARSLIWQISAFTVAHTVSLALTIYGWIALPAYIVEPLIALSIVFIAVENLLTSKIKPWRPLVVFAFGLLHGMGFASVLKELGLPQDNFLTALLSFNVGVELGQLSVVLLAMLILHFSFKQSWYRKAIAMPASLCIAAIGLVWSVERVMA
jgi:hypothetical protein